MLTFGFLTIHLGGAQLLACGVVIAFTVLNLFGVSEVAKLQNFLTGTKIVVICAFLLLGFSVGEGDWGHFSQAAERTSMHGVLTQLAISLVFVYYSYSGWNAAVYVAEEIDEPRKTLPIALVFGTLAVAVLFAALNCLYIYATPLEDMKGVLSVGSLAAVNLFGPRTAGFFSAAMAASLLATVNAMCMIGPRVYYAMAKDRAFFASAAKVHPRWKSPLGCGDLPRRLLLLADSYGEFRKPGLLHRIHPVAVLRALGAGSFQIQKKTWLGADTVGQLWLSAVAGALRSGESLDLCLLRLGPRAGSPLEYADHCWRSAGLPVLYSETVRASWLGHVYLFIRQLDLGGHQK